MVASCGVFDLFGHILKGTQGAPSMVSSCCSGEGVVADPHIGAEGIQVWRGDAGCIPNSGLPLLNWMRVCVCDVVYCTDSVALNHGIDVIQLGQ